jgi:phosphoserine aminotransferase
MSIGPCVKPKEWTWDALDPALLGRSHRSAEGVQSIAELTQSLGQLLEIPDTHWVGLTPGSATGALEMALWNLLRPETPIDVLEWDIFSQRWANSIEQELRLPVRRIGGSVPHVFQQLHPNHDCVLTWCGTTQGVWVGPYDDFLDRPDQCGGLVIADAASAVFTTTLPWEKLDVTTFSWQKGLGGEAGPGVIVLGPKALDRLNSYTPSWPIPWLMRLKDGAGLATGIFRGEMMNTCSMMLMAESAALIKIWRQRGGLSQALAQNQRNFQAVAHWCQDHPWVNFAVTHGPCRAHGPVVLSIQEPRFKALDVPQQWAFLRDLAVFLAKNHVGFDVLNHAKAFPALRIWCGPAVETDDLRALFPWIDGGLHSLFQRF